MLKALYFFIDKYITHMIQTGYTKHYYAGTERLATVIGGGGFGDMGAPIDKPTQREQEIVYAFDKQYQQSDPFWQGMVMSYPVPTPRRERNLNVK